jgi:hypothetical protein
MPIFRQGGGGDGAEEPELPRVTLFAALPALGRHSCRGA